MLFYGKFNEAITEDLNETTRCTATKHGVNCGGGKTSVKKKKHFYKTISGIPQFKNMDKQCEIRRFFINKLLNKMQARTRLFDYGNKGKRNKEMSAVSRFLAFSSPIS